MQRPVFDPLVRDTQVPYLWSRPWKKSIYFLGISSYNRNPEPKKVLKYSTPKPRFRLVEVKPRSSQTR